MLKNNIMMTTQTGIMITKTFGQNIFTFNVEDMFTLNGTKRAVYVIQETVWSNEDKELFGFDIKNSITKYKFYFDVATTEFGVINLAGKKLINNWINI
jgi:outer membrane protein assembly factor BamB